MSSKSQSVESEVSVSTKPPFSRQWSSSNKRLPTESEEAEARNQTLELGNETSVGYKKESSNYDPEKLPNHRYDWYKKLDQHNRDNYWKYRDDVQIGRDYDRQQKLKTTLGIASQLSLSELQKQIVVDRLFRLQLNRFGHRIEAVAFCLGAIVVNEEAKQRYKDGKNVYHPCQKDEDKGQDFLRVEIQLLETYGSLTKSRLVSVYNKLLQGDPPKRESKEMERFVANNTEFQSHPTFAPDWTLPRPTGSD